MKQQAYLLSSFKVDTRPKGHQSQVRWHKDKQLLLEHQDDGNGFKNHSPLNANIAATSTSEMDPTVNPQSIAHQQLLREFAFRGVAEKSLWHKNLLDCGF